MFLHLIRISKTSSTHSKPNLSCFHPKEGMGQEEGTYDPTPPRQLSSHWIINILLYTLALNQRPYPSRSKSN